MYKGEGIAVIIISVIDTALSLNITLGTPPNGNWANTYFFSGGFAVKVLL